MCAVRLLDEVVYLFLFLDGDLFQLIFVRLDNFESLDVPDVLAFHVEYFMWLSSMQHNIIYFELNKNIREASSSRF